jgi:hypothetical protein
MGKIVDEPMNEMYGLGVAFGMLLTIGMFMLSAAYMAAVGILLVYRFYKRLYSDEGYLTFTLPATTHQILLSSLVSNAIWALMAVAVEVICIGLLFYPMIRMTLGLAGEVMEFAWKEAFSVMGESFNESYVVAYILALLSGAVSSLVLPLLSITIGSLVAKKHKLLAGIGVYLGLNAVLSTFSGIISIVINIGTLTGSQANAEVVSIVTMIISAVLYMGIAVGGYFLMHHFADKKLNLP